MRRDRLRLFPVAGAIGVLGACSSLPSFGAPDAASREGREILHFWKGAFVAAVAVGAIVLGLIVYVTVRYRRRDEGVPGQRAGSTRAEVVYVGMPIVVVAVLFGFSTATEDDVTSLAPDPDVTVEVTGFQWGWRFEYRDRDGPVVVGSGERDSPRLVLPVGAVTRLILRSDDVIHSLWVPSFLSKRDLIPGIDNRIDVTPERIGVYDGRCAEYCGLDHWRMNFFVEVVSGDEFERFLTEASG